MNIQIKRKKKKKCRGQEQATKDRTKRAAERGDFHGQQELDMHSFSLLRDSEELEGSFRTCPSASDMSVGISPCVDWGRQWLALTVTFH